MTVEDLAHILDYETHRTQVEAQQADNGEWPGYLWVTAMTS